MGREDCLWSFFFSFAIYACSFCISCCCCSFYRRLRSWRLRFKSSALSCFSFSLRKYSPVSILMSSILGCCSGGNGVYSFLAVIARFFLCLSLTCLNFGKNRSQFSPLSYGSLDNSRLIISYLMWYIGWTFSIVSITMRRIIFTFLNPPIKHTVPPCTRM